MNIKLASNLFDAMHKLTKQIYYTEFNILGSKVRLSLPRSAPWVTQTTAVKLRQVQQAGSGYYLPKNTMMRLGTDTFSDIDL